MNDMNENLMNQAIGDGVSDTQNSCGCTGSDMKEKAMNCCKCACESVKNAAMTVYEKTKKPCVKMDFTMKAEIFPDYDLVKEGNGGAEENKPIMSSDKSGSVTFRIADAVIFTAAAGVAITALGCVMGLVKTIGKRI